MWRERLGFDCQTIHQLCFHRFLLARTAPTRPLFPLLLCLFMLPVPAGAISHVHLVLRQISAVGAHLLVSGYGIPVLKEGTTLYLPHATVEVADACSGVSTLQASVLLGMVLSYLSDSVRQRIPLLVAAVLLAVL